MQQEGPARSVGGSGERSVILIALVGLKPAVLTGTIWALAHEEIPVIPERVIAITTTRGREALEQLLFREGGWKALKDELAREGILADDDRRLTFGLSGHAIRLVPSADQSGNLEDIRTASDSDALAEFLMDTVRTFTENEETELVVSIAGGRKTMGVLLHSVISLLGRPWDRVTHILVDEPWEQIHGFLYPGCKGSFRDPVSGLPLQSESARLELATIPFVPLRYLFQRELQRTPASYQRLVHELSTAVADEQAPMELELNPRLAQVRINGRSVALSPREFAFLLFFAERQQFHLPPLSSFHEMTAERMIELTARHRDARQPGHWTATLLERGWDAKEDPRKQASSVRQKLRAAGLEPRQIDRIVPSRSHFAMHISADGIHLITTEPTGDCS